MRRASEDGLCGVRPGSRLVGGEGFEPSASRSRTLRTLCPPVSRRFLQCPPVLNFGSASCPLVSSCVLQVPRMRDTAVTQVRTQTGKLVAGECGPSRPRRLCKPQPDAQRPEGSLRGREQSQPLTKGAPARSFIPSNRLTAAAFTAWLKRGASARRFPSIRARPYPRS